MKSYKQIARDGEAEIVIKGSRFICALKRVENEDEAKLFIAEKKKEHKKATHNCSAFLIGDNDTVQRAHDDGEPSGTAGVPMLEVLKKNELHYIVAVVTRYFGGTKLGAGGLIRAYSSSVSYALNALGIIMHTQEYLYDVSIPYTDSGRFDYFLSQSAYRHLDTVYTDTVTYRIGVLPHQKETFNFDIQELFHNTITATLVDTHYIDLPIESEDVPLDDALFND
ncbi:YigZ family protein [Carnobacteriaceae bacterium zg-C25]|nr:YigZ family protein [Carnobacteriaceae bacterium zg-C25]